MMGPQDGVIAMMSISPAIAADTSKSRKRAFILLAVPFPKRNMVAC